MPTFMDTHRGPFRLAVTRPAKKTGFYTTEWLAGMTSREDVAEEGTGFA